MSPFPCSLVWSPCPGTLVFADCGECLQPVLRTDPSHSPELLLGTEQATPSTSRVTDNWWFQTVFQVSCYTRKGICRALATSSLCFLQDLSTKGYDFFPALGHFPLLLWTLLCLQQEHDCFQPGLLPPWKPMDESGSPGLDLREFKEHTVFQTATKGQAWKKHTLIIEF